jgi:hypothetical protein
LTILPSECTTHASSHVCPCTHALSEALNSCSVCLCLRLDHTSEILLSLMHKVFRYNLAAINFWLNNCVLPRETMQFPHRLVTSAFHLVTGHAIGFSGTKDSHPLLPLQVEQMAPADPTIASTDGLMLHLMTCERNREVICLPAGEALIDSVLGLATSRANALIDAGASMAGMSNVGVACAIWDKLRLLDKSIWDRHAVPCKGVVYFEVSTDMWMVLDLGGRTLSLGSSPVRESDCFVYYDESRCRGADMKLRLDAVAVVTISQGMGKEKWMQACYRMRKLELKQSVVSAVPAEVAVKIRALNELTAADELHSGHLLRWVMSNTVLATRDGLLHWGEQASHFIATHDHEAARLLDETHELEDLYGGSTSSQTVYDGVKRILDASLVRTRRLGAELSPQEERLAARVVEHAKLYGSDAHVTSSGLDEECERELETQRELEQEIERQVPRQAPAIPTTWDFNVLWDPSTGMSHPNMLPASAHVSPLEDAIASRFETDLKPISWAKCGIFVTGNFIETVTTPQGARVSDLSHYMRPVDALLLFSSSKTCLLLSEWEAEAILQGMHSCSKAPRLLKVALVNLRYLLEATDSSLPLQRPQLLVPSGATYESPGEHMLAGLQLLAGDTMFKPRRRGAIKKLLTTSAAKKSAFELVALRGRRHEIYRSDLEVICTGGT